MIPWTFGGVGGRGEGEGRGQMSYLFNDYKLPCAYFCLFMVYNLMVS